MSQKIELVPISTVMLDPANVRKHPTKNIEGIKASLVEFGQQTPVVIDAKGIVRKGNGTVIAARELGWESIKAIRTDLEGSRAVAYSIADNQHGLTSEWADVELAETLRALQSEDFNLDAVGFDEAEIDALCEKLGGDILGEQADAPAPEAKVDRAEELLAKWGVKPGQLWVIPSNATPGGEHRLLCGDSTKAEDVARVMGGDKAIAVISDPPYGIGYQYDTHDDSEANWFGLMNTVVPMMRALAPFVVIPCCAIKRLGWWYASHPPDWIMCWYKGSPGHRSHVGFNDWEPHLVWGKPPGQMHDYWQTACGFEVDGHPCPKPVAYATWLMERAAEAGQAVCDFFAGSGTTIVAAEQTGRLARGIEIAPKYCSVILERLSDMGLKPRLAS